MPSKVVMKQNGNLAKLVKKLKALNKQKVEFGYFQEQGIHTPSNLYFTELMRIHEDGLGVSVRPVLGIHTPYGYTIKGQMESSSFTKMTSNWLKDYVRNIDMTNDRLADKFSMWAVHSAGDIFGQSPPLRYTYNETPLIDTGELSDNFAWRVSWQGVIRTL